MDTFSALADPTRRNILEILAINGQLSATDISNNFRISAPAVSQHLKVLRAVKLVDMEKHAQKRLYQINPVGIAQLETWVKKINKSWEERFLRLDKLLEEEKKKLRGGEKHE